MSKFKLKLKLQGLEIEMEGTRDEIPKLAKSVGDQLAGIIEPAANVASGNTNQHGHGVIEHVPETSSPPKRKGRRKNSAAPVKPNKSENLVVEWSHDASKYGNPQQNWNPTKKAIWLLYVVKQELRTEQLTASQIANTFNHKFKQAGKITPSNVSRDLGKQKQSVPPTVGDDTTKEVVEWYLNDAGISMAQSLIVELITPNGTDQ